MTHTRSWQVVRPTASENVLPLLGLLAHLVLDLRPLYHLCDFIAGGRASSQDLLTPSSRGQAFRAFRTSGFQLYYSTPENVRASSPLSTLLQREKGSYMPLGKLWSLWASKASSRGDGFGASNWIGSAVCSAAQSFFARKVQLRVQLSENWPKLKLSGNRDLLSQAKRLDFANLLIRFDNISRPGQLRI